MSKRDERKELKEPRGVAKRSRTLDRRGFFRRISGTTAAAALLPIASADAASIAASSHEALPTQLSDHQWRTLAAVQDHLFPSQAGSPGAKDIQAMTYLNRVLADPGLDPAERDFLKNGIGWLEEIAVESQDGPFATLPTTKREAALRELEGTGRGENWIATVLMHIFEALLCDPAYGGNPEGVGWRWLQHDPGFPRPSDDKIYGKL